MTQEEFFAEWSMERGELTARTSGSTGRPKEIRLSADIVMESARRTNRFFGITSASRLHVPLDFNYIAAKMMGVRATLSGATLTSEIPSNRPMSDRDRFTSEEMIDLLAVVPSQMEYILDNLAELPGIRAVIIGGGAISESLRKRIILSEMNAWETYGMTETASHIALRKVGDEWFETFDDISVSLTDSGCLRIVIKGFPEFNTNDIAILKDERHFNIVGRVDNVINTGGKKVYTEELERKLAEVWPDIEFAITSRPDNKWGESIVAVVTGNEKGADRLRESARKVLEAYMLPKEIRFIGALPRTSNGKVNRNALKALVL